MKQGSMRHYANGRKKSYNAWTPSKENKGSHDMETFVPTFSSSPRRGAQQAAALKSIDTTEMHTAKVESKKYTGTLVKGISTMHKSNAVPILSQDEAKEHAHMRR